MNKNIEDIIKEALENHDSGYVSGAWESMSARLDGTPSTPFYKKWWVAAAFGTALVGTAAFFMLNENKITEKQEVVHSKQDKVSQKHNLTVNNPESIIFPSENTNSDQNSSSPVAVTENVKNNNTVSTNNNSVSNAATSGNPIRLSNSANDISGTKQNPDASVRYAIPDLPKSVCLNEIIPITNSNTDKPIFIVDPSGKRTEIPVKTTLMFTAKSGGTITVQSGDHADHIVVNENKTNLYINVDPSLLYENGIPTLKFSVSGNSGNLVWDSNIKDNETKGDTYIVHPYTEKSVEIRVSNTNEAGCKVEEKQVVTLDERYNLLAPTAFDPTSSDPRNKTFMPYALTERSVAFEMLIIDPRTGAKVYSTTDSAEGWTGVDQRTGEMVKPSSVWAWKVIIKNPNTGEPREYSGTITKL